MKKLLLTLKLVSILTLSSTVLYSCDTERTNETTIKEDTIYRGKFTSEMISRINHFVGEWKKNDDNTYKITIDNFRADTKLIDISITKNGNTVDYKDIYINSINSDYVLRTSFSVINNFSYYGNNKMYVRLPETNSSTAFFKN